MVTPMAPESAATGAAEEKSTSFSSPARILLLALWIGLTAGFLDLGLMLVKNRLIGESFYHLGIHFRWVIPAAVGAMLLLPGAALACVACFRQRALSPALTVGLLSFVGFLDVAARLPLELWASLLLSGGLAVQSVHLAGRGRGRFFRLVRRTTPMLVGALVAIAL